MKSFTLLRALFLSVSLSAGLAGCGENTPPPPDAFCGDGALDDGEQCDDGNSVNDDGCDSLCQIEIPPAPVCGDGNQEGNEACDDGNLANGDGCNAQCQVEPPPGAVCGNGATEAGEACDDGNQINTDACTNACELPICGDAILSLGEQCDDGNQTDTDFCRNTCVIPRCGDGLVSTDIGEQCDDSNTDSNDGCDSGCITEFCGDGTLQTNLGEECDDGNALDTDGCHTNCLVPVCGDGLVDPEQFCFDGGVNTQLVSDLTSATNSGELLFIDLNAGTIPDLLVTAPQIRGVIRVLGSGNGFGSLGANDSSLEGTQMASGDFDLDGDIDAVVLFPGNGFRVLSNNNGIVTFGNLISVAGASAIAAGDITEDGELDVAIASTTADNIQIFAGSTGAQFIATTNTIALGAGADPAAVAIEDVNNDGNLDIIATAPGTNEMAVSLSIGFGFGAPVFSDKFLFLDPTELIVADMNGDTKPEVIVSAKGIVDTFRVNANGSLTTISSVQPVSGQVAPIAVGDLDADGDLDLIVTNPTSRDPNVIDDVLVFLNNSAADFSNTPDFTFAAGNICGDIEVADLNGDGVSDIVVLNYGDNSLTSIFSNP